MQRRLLNGYRIFEDLGVFFSRAKQPFACSPCGRWHGVTPLMTCVFILSFVCLFVQACLGGCRCEGAENRTEIWDGVFEN